MAFVMLQLSKANCLCAHSDSAIKVYIAKTQVWRQTLWTDIRTDVMEEGTKAFVKEVKALPKAVRDEDCFKVGTWELIHGRLLA